MRTFSDAQRESFEGVFFRWLLPRGRLGPSFAPFRPVHSHGLRILQSDVLLDNFGAGPQYTKVLPPYFANCSRRSNVSGYLAASNRRAAAWALGLARPCSHFSRVRSLVKSLRAKTLREQ